MPPNNVAFGMYAVLHTSPKHVEIYFADLKDGYSKASKVIDHLGS